jgi:hypothetical protein
MIPERRSITLVAQSDCNTRRRREMKEKNEEMSLEERRSVVSEILREMAKTPEGRQRLIEEALISPFASNEFKDHIRAGELDEVIISPENLERMASGPPRTEPLSIRLTEKEMKALNQMAVARSQEKGEPVSKSDIVREVMFENGDSHIRVMNDWESLSSSRFDLITAGAMEAVDVTISYMSIAPKILSHKEEKRNGPKMRGMALSGRIPRIGTIRMNDFCDGDVEMGVLEIVNMMNVAVSRMVMDHVDRMVLASVIESCVETLRVEYATTSDRANFGAIYESLKAKSMTNMQKSGSFPAKTICGADAFYHIVKHDPEFEEGTHRDIMMSGLYGHLGSTDVHMTNAMTGSHIIFLPPGDTVGSLDLLWHVEPFKDADGFGWAVYADARMSGLRKGAGILLQGLLVD